MSALLILALLALPIALYVAPQLLQGLAFVWAAQRLFALHLGWVEYCHAFVVYAAVYLALHRYLPRTARGVDVLLCAAWTGLGVTLATVHADQVPVLRGPIGLLLGAIGGGAVGSWANFRNPIAFFLLLEQVPIRALRRRPPRTDRPPHASTQRPDQARRQPRQDVPPGSPNPPPAPPSREPPDAWTVLGVQRNATAEQISRAYRDRMREYHPDRVMGLGPELAALAEQKAKEINRAYELLRGRG